MSHLYDYTGRIPGARMAIVPGCIGVLRYLQGPTALDAAEVAELHGAGLAISPIWETDADQADHPERGAGDAWLANAVADRLGVPDNVVIWFADDRNDTDDDQEIGYFTYVQANSKRPVGIYGPGHTIENVMGYTGVGYGWKVETWGGPAPHAHLIQLANTKEPVIPGWDGGYDTNILIAPFPMWEPQHSNGEEMASAYPRIFQSATRTLFVGSDGMARVLASSEFPTYFRLFTNELGGLGEHNITGISEEEVDVMLQAQPKHPTPDEVALAVVAALPPEMPVVTKAEVEEAVKTVLNRTGGTYKSNQFIVHVKEA